MRDVDRGLSYVSVLQPYQQYFKLFAGASLIYSHYRLYKGVVSKTEEKIIWISTIVILIVLLSPMIVGLLL